MRRSPLGKTCKFWSILVALVLLAAVPALALHQESPGAIRITKSGPHQHTTGRNWGNYTSFVSSADLAFTGNTTQQAFVFKLFPWVCQNGDPTVSNQALCSNPPDPIFEQATSGPGNPSGPSVGLPSGICEFNSARTCQNDGNCVTGPDDFGACIITSHWIAFEADGAFNGGTGPGVGRRQVFMKNLLSDEVVRVTDSDTGDSTRPSINELGGIMVFQSTATLGGVPNPGGVPQIFVYERRTNLRRQITFGQGPSINPVANRTGNLIVFQSRADLLGSGVDTGVWQIWVAGYDRTTHSATLTRLTSGDADSLNPWISETERWITFESSASNLGGVPGANQIYLVNLRDEGPEIRQITDQATYGDCHFPVVDVRANRMAFVCNGDPLQNGTVGNRLFVFDPTVDPNDPLDGPVLRQITGAGDVIPPVAHNLGLWFLTFATTSNLDGQGSCGVQLFALNYFDGDLGHWRGAQEIGELPPDVAGDPPPGEPTTNFIGRRTLLMQPGDGVVGTSATLTTQAGTTTIPLTGEGAITMVIGAPDEFTGISSVTVRAEHSSMPPIPLPGVGAICLTPIADGGGKLSCEGGAPGGDLMVIQDHNTDDSDPSCVFGCREGDASCQGELPGPHVFPCPVCIGGFCGLGSTNAGAACTVNADCVPSQQCLGGFYGVCNGEMIDSPGGAFVAGGLQLTMPMALGVSQAAGLDGLFCTGDDNYGAEGVQARMLFNTGLMDGVVLDADNVPGATLLSTDMGAPFNCVSLDAGVMFGAALVGTLPILDVPNVPQLRDTLVRLRIEPRIEPGVCEATCGSDLDCDDSNPCNGPEFCVNGVCLAGAPIMCDDGDPCNGTETCDPGTGVCIPGTPCNDGDACNGVEVCDAVNGCQPGTPVVCLDGDVCNGDETCDPVTGGCLPGAPLVCDDGDVCTGLETCDPLTGCVPGIAIDCSDGDACNGDETCDPLTGACGPGTPPNCDDSNVCTDDSCNPAIGCENVPNADPCDDLSLCTTGDTCSGGACVGTPLPCDDGDACNGFEDCDPLTGTCLPGVPPICDDANDCTDDSCNPATGCANLPNTNPCDDGSVCTTGDTCNLGSCMGAFITCDDGDACNGPETCDPVLGCQAGVAPNCDDGTVCTDDSCDPGLGCMNVPNTNPCNDNDACTINDTCAAGSCMGAFLVCDDGDACNGSESCDSVQGCLPGSPLVCDDGNACTDDSCDPGLGCMATNNTDPCDDGNLCTTGDVCGGGSCGGTPVVCDDGDVCNGAEVCDPLTGSCVPGTGPVCDDGNPCTDDSCDPVLGCMNTNNNAPCDDGLLCTTNDICNGGVCTGSIDVMCSLSELEQAILDATPQELGNARRQRRLLRMALRSRTRTEAALFGNPQRAARNYNRSAKVLAKMVKKLDRWMKRGRVDTVVGTEIRDLAAAALAQVQLALTTSG